MAQFASADDLAARLGVELGQPEQTRAEALLKSASGLIQAEARQVIERVTDDEVILPGTSDDRLRLPERPVVSVASVAIDGETLAATGYYLDAGALVRRQLDSLALGCSGFGAPSQEVRVVYTHGYAADEMPETVKSVCLEAVVRVWVNPGAVIGERHGSEQVQYMNGQPTGLLLTGAERAAIRRLFGRRARSVSQS